MTLLGYCAVVALSLVARRISDDPCFVDDLLAYRERQLWDRCVTIKRRTEFIGGRLAAKLCATLYRNALGLPPKNLSAIEVYPLYDRRPVCLHDDGLCHSVSISHSHGWAEALVPAGRGRVGLDIEAAGSRVRPAASFFTEAELSQLGGAEEARLYWTLKEAYGKLTGQGVIGYVHDMKVLRHEGRLWLAVPERIHNMNGCLLSAGTYGRLAMSVGFSDDVGTALKGTKDGTAS